MPDSSRLHSDVDMARLDAVLAPIARAHGAEVVAVEWRRETGGWVLRVYVEKAGSAEKSATTQESAVSLELCAGVARDLSPALDVADLIPHRYNLEVSSPGVERPLTTARDFARFAGQKAKIRLDKPVLGQKVVTGVLEALGAEHPGAFGVRDGEKLFVVPLEDVGSAHLVFEFGPAPRPGRGKAAQAKRPRHSSGGHDSTAAPHDETKDALSPSPRGDSDSR